MIKLFSIFRTEENENGMDIELMIDDILLFFSAGSDTTVNTICKFEEITNSLNIIWIFFFNFIVANCIYQLSQHPKILEKYANLKKKLYKLYNLL